MFAENSAINVRMTWRPASDTASGGGAGCRGTNSDGAAAQSDLPSPPHTETEPIEPVLLNEEDCLARAIHGDDNALCELLRSLDSDLRYHVAMTIGTRHRHAIEVEDVVQVTYLEAFLRIGRFHHSGERAFRAWLWQVAGNNVRDALRVVNCGRRPPPDKRIAPENREDSYLDLLIQMGGTHSTPSKLVAREEAERIMNDAIDRLPSDYAMVVRLCDLEGYSAAQAAAAMRRSSAAVRMLRARAHDRLADIIGSGVSF